MVPTRKKGEVVFGLDFGSDSLKAAFCAETSRGVRYGKIAYSFFDDAFPACAYYDEETREWVFGEEIFAGNKDYRRIVRIHDLLMLHDGTEGSAYCKKNEFPVFSPNFIVREDDGTDNKRRTFKAQGTPRDVCERFFAFYAAEYFWPSVGGLRKVYPGMEMPEGAAECLITFRDNAADHYVAELVRLIEKTGRFKAGEQAFRTRTVSRATAVYAFEHKDLEQHERALIADIGQSCTSVSLVEGMNLSKYVGVYDTAGESYNRDIYEYIKTKTKIIEGDALGTNYQLFNLELRINNAKAALSIPAWSKTRIEVETGVTAMVHMTREDFLTATQATTAKLCAHITDALKAEKGVNKIILTGGASQTCGLADALKKAAAKVNPAAKIIAYGGDDSRQKADSIYDIFNTGMKFSGAAGAAILACKHYVTTFKAPKSYGIKTIDTTRNMPMISIVVKKNSTSRGERTFSPAKDITDCREGLHTALFSTDRTESFDLIDADTAARLRRAGMLRGTAGSYSLTSPGLINEDEMVRRFIQKGIITPKDLNCQIFFPRPVKKDFTFTLQIDIDSNDTGRVRVYNGNEEFTWSGKSFSTQGDKK